MGGAGTNLMSSSQTASPETRGEGKPPRGRRPAPRTTPARHLPISTNSTTFCPPTGNQALEETRARGMPLILRFILLTLGGFAALAVILSLSVSRVLTVQMTERESLTTANAVRTITAVDLTEEQFAHALAGGDTERFRNLVRHLREHPEIVRVKIYEGGGRLVWSDDPRHLPPPPAPNAELRGALAGAVTTNIGVVKPEHRFEIQDFGQRLMEIYVPLLHPADRKPYAVVEVYEVPALLDRQIAASRRWVWSLCVGGAGLVFASLSGLYWRAWRRERRLADQLESAHRFNIEVLENAPYGLMLVDRDGTILAWNAAMAQMCKCIPDQRAATACRLRHLRPAWLGEGLAAQAEEAFETGGLVPGREIICPGCDLGDHFSCAVIAIPISGVGAGASDHVLLAVEDITLVRRLRGQLAHSEKLSALGQVCAGLSHEINSPLGIIMTKIRILLSEGREREIPEDFLRELEVVDRHTGRIAEIVRNLLQFARRPASAMRSLDLNRVVREALALVEKPFVSGGIDIRADLAREPLHFLGNSDELQQVLVNLMTNARDAMAPGGRLTVSTAREAPPRAGVVAEVIDTGTGIAKERLDKIFDPFFTTKEVGKGTGLGLSVTKSIVRSHGGTIEVASEIGSGSTFRVILPALEGNGRGGVPVGD